MNNNKKSINILILSVGTRNKIVQYFKKELNLLGAKVIAADSSEFAPALYEADKFYIIPKITDENYLERVLDICEENDIGGVFSLIDPELSILAKNRNIFIDRGITPIISDYDIIEQCFDKYAFYELLTANAIPTVKTFSSLGSFEYAYAENKIEFPVFVKPRKGSASLGIQKIDSFETLIRTLENKDDYIIQEYMSGQEYGADIYIDMLTGELVSVFIKQKLLMRAGETDKSISVKKNKIKELIINLTNKINLRGIIDIDIFEKNGNYFISEINPRFGGGYPHAYECGVNIPNLIINNIACIDNGNIEFDYEENIIMMKYNEIMIK